MKLERTPGFCATTSWVITEWMLSRKNCTRPLVDLTSPVAWLIGLPISRVSLHALKLASHHQVSPVLIDFGRPARALRDVRLIVDELQELLQSGNTLLQVLGASPLLLGLCMWL